MVAPAVPLYRFQRNWLADKSRFKIGKMSRQIGKSFSVGLEAVDDAVETGDDWVLLSAGERQSKELMHKVKMHCEAYTIAASDIQQDEYIVGRAKYAMLHIELPNGARIIGLPANPDTARGFTANVILDEFGIHKNSKEIWAAMFPTVTRGYKVRVVSTPKGLGNRFHSLFTGDNDWSKHFVDIYQAVADGVPVNIEELKKAIDDPDLWAQEYECKFIDQSSVLLNYDIITACQDDSVAPEIKYEDFDINSLALEPKGPVYGGVDIGRKRDLTVFEFDELLGDVFWTRLIVVLAKVKFREQEKLLADLIEKLNVTRCCIDSTGMGMQLGENTVDRFPGRAEAVEFSNKVKGDLAIRTLRIFEDRRTRIPISRVYRDDLHAVKKMVTAAGNIRYDSERTDEGHSDRFWAKSLVFMASDEGVIPQCILL